MASSSAYSATGEDAAALMAMGVPQPGQAVAQYTIMKQQPAEGATDPMAAMAAAVQQASRAAGIDPAVGMAALQTMPGIDPQVALAALHMLPPGAGAPSPAPAQQMQAYQMQMPQHMMQHMPPPTMQHIEGHPMPLMTTASAEGMYQMQMPQHPQQMQAAFEPVCSQLSSSAAGGLAMAAADAQFTCPVCRKIFKKEANLIYHMTEHRPIHPGGGLPAAQPMAAEDDFVGPGSNGMVKCTDCDKQFATKYQAKKHYLRRHFSGEKPFACTKCGKKRFVVKEDLTMHMKACGNVYVCKCGIRLCSLGALKRHCKQFSHEPASLDPTPESTALLGHPLMPGVALGQCAPGSADAVATPSWQVLIAPDCA